MTWSTSGRPHPAFTLRQNNQQPFVYGQRSWQSFSTPTLKIRFSILWLFWGIYWSHSFRFGALMLCNQGAGCLMHPKQSSNMDTHTHTKKNNLSLYKLRFTQILTAWMKKGSLFEVESKDSQQSQDCFMTEFSQFSQPMRGPFHKHLVWSFQSQWIMGKGSVHQITERNDWVHDSDDLILPPY